MSENWKSKGGARVLIHGVIDNGTIYPIKGSRMGASDYVATDVYIQDQHSPPFFERLHSDLQSGLTFAVAPSVGDWQITLTAGHGFTGASELIYLREGSNYQVVETVAVAGNVITLDAMIDSPYTVGATIDRISDALNVDGSGTRQIFHAFPPPNREWDMMGIRFSMICATAPDDSKFGDLAALLRGVNIHVLVAEGVPFSLGTFHTNGDFARIVGSVDYADKGGGGSHSVRVTGSVRMDWGVTIRLRGTVADLVYTRDEVRVVIQDDVVGLTSFQSIIFGHDVVD